MPSSFNPPEFVPWFRQVAPYIHAFREKVFVIAFGGEVVQNTQFMHLIHDFNLLNSLGVKLILVHGARPQIEQQTEKNHFQTHYHQGIRITDSHSLQTAIQAISQVKVTIEAYLSMGLANSPMANAHIRVASGNFITARPMGIRDGVDFLYTGEVRKVDTQAIQHRLQQGETVLLSPLGYSPTGEIFNLTLEDIATSVAIALQAEKLIFLQEETGVIDQQGKLLQALTAAEAARYLQTHTVTDDIYFYLPKAVMAVRQGVGRAHLISRHIDGALLHEFFSHAGIGTMISRDRLQTLRQATIDDVGGLLRLIEPLEEEGILVKRGRELIECEIDHYTVLEHDGKIIACVAFHSFTDNQTAELACLVVHPDYRDADHGENLLAHVEKQAINLGVTQLFVLTTRTAHWFIERGFVQASMEDLPIQKKALYNLQRRSTVFIKQLAINK